MNRKIKTLIGVIITILMASYLFIPLVNKDYFYELNTLDEFYSLDNKFIYFGSSNCPSCEGFKPILETFANRNMYEVYYFNFKYFAEEKLVNEKELNKIIKDYNIKEIPILIELRNKKNIANIVAHVYNVRGEDHIENQLKCFFEGSNSFKTVPLYDIHNIVYLVIYISLYLISIIFLFTPTKNYKVIYFIILMIIIFNCANMWNYGVYIDENNLGVTYHIGYLGWVNIILAGIIFLTKQINLKRRKEA